MKSIIHSQISTVAPLKFGNGYIILSHILLWNQLLIHVGIKVKRYQKERSLASCVVWSQAAIILIILDKRFPVLHHRRLKQTAPSKCEMKYIFVFTQMYLAARRGHMCIFMIDTVGTTFIGMSEYACIRYWINEAGKLFIVLWMGMRKSFETINYTSVNPCCSKIISKQLKYIGIFFLSQQRNNRSSKSPFVKDKNLFGCLADTMVSDVLATQDEIYPRIRIGMVKIIYHTYWITCDVGKKDTNR